VENGALMQITEKNILKEKFPQPSLSQKKINTG